MNTLVTCSIPNPQNKIDECAGFIIDDLTDKFVLSDVLVPGQKYMLSFWVRSETDGNLVFRFQNYPTSTAWQKYVIPFTPTEEYILLKFSVAGTYYIYHPKLEVGDKATDWSPAPEDVDSGIDAAQSTADSANESATTANARVTTAESLIQQLSNCISMLVVDANGESLMTQTENGWTFSMKETTDAVSSLSNTLNELQQQETNTQATVGALQQALNDHGSTLEYVNIITYEDEPCIELGESDSDFKLLITNTRIMFRHGSSIPTYINTNGLVTQNITVENEIVQGGYAMLKLSDNSWGLLWKGVSS